MAPSQVRWGDKKGGYGEHYWEYNHGPSYKHHDGYGKDHGHGYGKEAKSEPEPYIPPSPPKYPAI